jgi:hypothetical protein
MSREGDALMQFQRQHRAKRRPKSLPFMPPLFNPFSAEALKILGRRHVPKPSDSTDFKTDD